MRFGFVASLLGALTLMSAADAAAVTPMLATDAANAASLNTGLSAMRNYNLIVLQDLTSKSNVHGRAFVGGDLKGNNSSDYNVQPRGQTGTALTVVGNVTGGTKNINNGGAVKVGGNLDSGANMNGGGKVEVDGNGKKINGNGGNVYIDGNAQNINAGHVYVGGSTSGYINGVKHLNDHTVAGMQQTLQAEASLIEIGVRDLSTYFAAMAPTSAYSYSPDGQAIRFNAGTGSGVAVFSITNLTQALQNRSRLEWTFPTSFDTVIVNVAGTNISLPGGINFNGPANLGQKVIWNFYEATTLNFGSKAWYGSVLAPQADATIGNFIEGTTVFKSLKQNGEIHMNNYAGGLEAILAPTDLTISVPEPATWAMLIMGFGAVGTLIRRRRAIAA